MSFSINEVRASKVWFDEDNMWVALLDGRTLSVPKVWFPKLSSAKSDELEQYEMSGNGAAIHWENLDEDISVPNLLLGYGAVSSKVSVA